MGLANKIVLATKKTGTLASWQGDMNLSLIYAGLDAYVYSYTRFYQDEGEGTLTPLLQTVKTDTQIYNLTLAVDPSNIMLFEATLSFYDNPESMSPASKEFKGLKKCVIHSATGGSPFVIDDMKSLFDVSNSMYDLFSEDLANWGYQNLTAGETLDFTFELGWYE